MIEQRFQAAVNACKKYEDTPTDETEEAFSIARGKYRGAVIDVMHEKLQENANTYNHLAAELVEVFEEIAQVDRFFVSNGLNSGLPTTFTKDVCLPPTSNKGKKYVCGRQARTMSFPFAETFSEEGAKMWQGTFMYYDDHDRLEKQSPFTHRSEPKEFNAPLG